MHLSILPSGARLPDAAGNVLVAEGGEAAAEQPALGITWMGRNRLQVSYDSRLRVSKQRKAEAAVVIEYLPIQ